MYVSFAFQISFSLIITCLPHHHNIAHSPTSACRLAHSPIQKTIRTSFKLTGMFTIITPTTTTTTTQSFCHIAEIQEYFVDAPPFPSGNDGQPRNVSTVVLTGFFEMLLLRICSTLLCMPPNRLRKTVKRISLRRGGCCLYAPGRGCWQDGIDRPDGRRLIMEANLKIPILGLRRCLIFALPPNY